LDGAKPVKAHRHAVQGCIYACTNDQWKRVVPFLAKKLADSKEGDVIWVSLGQFNREMQAQGGQVSAYGRMVAAA